MEKPQYVVTQRTGKGVKLALLLSGLGIFTSFAGFGVSLLAESYGGMVFSTLAAVACGAALVVAKIVRWWRYE